MSMNAEAKVTLSLVDRISGPINRIAAKLSNIGNRLGFDRIGGAARKLSGAIAGLGDGLSRTAGRLSSFLAILGFGGAGAITAAYGLAKSVSDLGSEIGESSQKLGIGVEALQEYRFAAAQSGIEAETLNKGIQKLGINAYEASKGNKELTKAFKTLGVRVTDTKGKMRSTEDVLDDTFSALSQIKDPLKRNALAFKLFGKSGVELTKMLANGAEGLRDVREEARRTGAIMGQSAVDAADEFGDRVDALVMRLDGFKRFVGVQLLPVFTEAVKGITEWADANQDLIRSQITEWAKSMISVIKQLIDPTSEIRQKFRDFGEAVSSAYEKIKPLVDFMGGPLASALALIGLWALGPAILGIGLLAGAFANLGIAIAGVAISTISTLAFGVTDLAAGGLAKTLTAAGSTSGALFGKAFGLAARLAIVAAIAAATAEILQTVDPKGNLGGLTKPLDDYLREKLGLPSKDTGITPGEVWTGLGNLFGGKPMQGPPMPVKDKLSPVARDLGFGDSPIFGDKPQGPSLPDMSTRPPSVPSTPSFQPSGPSGAPASGGSSTVQAGVVTTQSIQVAEPIIAHQPQTVNAPLNVGGITINVQGMTPEQAKSMVSGALANAQARQAASVKSSLSD